jgi:hypothetical protein
MVALSGRRDPALVVAWLAQRIDLAETFRQSSPIITIASIVGPNPVLFLCLTMTPFAFVVSAALITRMPHGSTVAAALTSSTPRR